MATISKAATGTALATGASWTGGVTPGAADVATWLTTSLGPGLTGALTVLGIDQQGATGNITHSSGTITLGASGFTQASTNNRNWAESGVLAIGAVDQTWALGITTVTPVTSALSIGGTAGLTGSGILSLANNSGTSEPTRALMTVAGANAGFTGTLRMLANSGLNFNAAGCLTACNIEVNGDGAYLRNVGAHSFGASGKTLTFNANGKMGSTGGLLTCNSPVVLGSTSRLISFAGDVTFAAALSGTGGVQFAGPAPTWVDVTLNAINTLTTATGFVTIEGYTRVLSNAASWYLPDARSFLLSGSSVLQLGGVAGAGFTTPQAIAAGTTFTGNGLVLVLYNSTNTVTFPAGALAGLTGDLDPAASSWTTYIPQSGLCLGGVGFYASGRSCDVSVNDLPTRVASRVSPNSNNPNVTRLRYIGPGATYYTQIDLVMSENTYPAQCRHEVYANCSDANPLVLMYGVKRFGLSAAQTFYLRGDSTADNEIAGPIDPNSLGTLSVTKEDAGKWVLSGANLYTGVTTVSDGTLSAQSSSALGTTGAVTVSGTGVLMLEGGVTVNKSSGAFTIHANNPIVSVGDNTLQTAGITLGGTTTFEVTTGNKLTLANTGAITDGASTFGITKTGAGELVLADFANTYNGNVTVTTGTLSVSALNTAATNGTFGAAGANIVSVNATLKYIGSTATSTDRVQLDGATPTLQAEGSGAATFSAFTQTSGARQLTLTGSSTAANNISAALANNTSATGIAKNGGGKWLVTGAMSYTGATDVNEGTLRFERPDGNTMASTVTVDAGAFLELATDTMASSGATAGRVLGTGNVVVNGTVKTRGGTTQKGQVRYGGNLTFGSGSSLYIGAAA